MLPICDLPASHFPLSAVFWLSTISISLPFVMLSSAFCCSFSFANASAPPLTLFFLSFSCPIMFFHNLGPCLNCCPFSFVFLLLFPFDLFQHQSVVCLWLLPVPSFLLLIFPVLFCAILPAAIDLSQSLGSPLIFPRLLSSWGQPLSLLPAMLPSSQLPWPYLFCYPSVIAPFQYDCGLPA